jgi:hypothetical protein
LIQIGAKVQVSLAHNDLGCEGETGLEPAFLTVRLRGQLVEVHGVEAFVEHLSALVFHDGKESP